MKTQIVNILLSIAAYISSIISDMANSFDSHVGNHTDFQTKYYVSYKSFLIFYKKVFQEFLRIEIRQ